MHIFYVNTFYLAGLSAKIAIYIVKAPDCFDRPT